MFEMSCERQEGWEEDFKRSERRTSHKYLLLKCKKIIMFDFSKREKNVLIFGIVFVVLFLSLQFGVAPLFEKRENLNRILIEKQAALSEMINLQQQFLAVSNNFNIETQILSNRKKDFSLFSFLDSHTLNLVTHKKCLNITHSKCLSKAC